MSGVVHVTAELLRSRPLPEPDDEADKDSRGKVLVAGGSPTSAGAALLAGTAALRAGAGKILLAVPRSLSLAIAVAFPEAGVHAFDDDAAGDPVPDAAARQIRALLERAHAGLIGPGLTHESAAQALAEAVLSAPPGAPLVIDAMSLTGLWARPDRLEPHRGRLVITPHAGEMARLTGIPREAIAADPQRHARRAAEHLGCLVVLKGATTVIVEPCGPAYVHEAGNVALATSGSGDVLAGVLAALIARGASPLDAALWSVSLHARAGERLTERLGPVGLLARELPGEIPRLMRELAHA